VALLISDKPRFKLITQPVERWKLRYERSLTAIEPDVSHSKITGQRGSGFSTNSGNSIGIRATPEQTILTIDAN
jgi:hypothetical protein